MGTKTRSIANNLTTGLGAGKVLQKKTATFTSQDTVASSTEEVTGHSIAITPVDSTSNIFVSCSFSGKNNTGGRSNTWQLRLTNASGTIIGKIRTGDASGGDTAMTIVVDGNHDHNTSSEITYVLTHRTDGSGTITTNYFSDLVFTATEYLP